MLRAIHSNVGIKMVIPHAVGAHSRHILSQRAIDDWRGKRAYAGSQSISTEIPRRACCSRRSSTVGLLFSRDAVLPVLAAELSLVGVAQVGVVHAEVIIRMGVGNLRQSTEVRSVSARQEDAQLLGESCGVVLVRRLVRLQGGVRKQHHDAR